MACDGNCSSCSEECESKEIQKEKMADGQSAKKIIAVVSGKGGVGKSTVTAALATQMRRKGYEVGVLDADVTGPSIPKIFGIEDQAKGTADGKIYPEISAGGVKAMSVNLLLENPDDPVIWRGPILAGAVKQFFSDVLWGELDYMFIDMPPGTGDVPLTVFQSLPIDGIVIVTSPQELVSMIVKKAYKMAQMMNIPVYGIVENMSYLKCPDCGKEIKLFGESNVEKTCDDLGVMLLGKMPIDPELAELADEGRFEFSPTNYLAEAADLLDNANK